MVRYNPRAGWSSGAHPQCAMRVSAVPTPTDECVRERQYAETVRLPTLKSRRLDERPRFWPKTQADWRKRRDLFMDRAQEFAAENQEYRRAHYAAYTHLEGPHVRACR